MLVGGMLIAIGHIILGISGFGEMAHSRTGMSLFIMGLAVIVLGTGHFKPTVSVMVGQLYKQGDPRRDGAFTIFYMGINLGAFICAFVCGTLGEKVGWHWGFGSAAVGMIAGLMLYMVGKPKYLNGIGDAPKQNAGRVAPLFLLGSLAAVGAFALAYHFGAMGKLDEAMTSIQKNQTLSIALIAALGGGILLWIAMFVAKNDPGRSRPGDHDLHVHVLQRVLLAGVRAGGLEHQCVHGAEHRSHDGHVRGASDVVPVGERRPDLHPGARSSQRSGHRWARSG
jgi:dipeptide/tripeptide permease